MKENVLNDHQNAPVKNIIHLILNLKCELDMFGTLHRNSSLSSVTVILSVRVTSSVP